MNNHSLRTFGGLAVVFLGGAISAYKGGFSLVNILDMVISGLLAVEHLYNGNTAF